MPAFVVPKLTPDLRFTDGWGWCIPLMRLKIPMKLTRNIILFALCAICVPFSHADEGMWLFNNPPRKILKDRYNFEPTDQWLEHVQKSSVRFNSGGSGSFVSPDGLVMTNHHVGADCLQKISTKEKDYVKSGFEARSRSEEPKCVDLELNVLMGIEDVTTRVAGAVTSAMNSADAEKARRAVINDIEKESRDKTGLRSNVITLYNGGQYHLYRYKRYTDVRLVFAPQKSIAFFGGDPDNFEYQRDLVVPGVLNLLRRREVLLKNYSDRNIENARRAEDDLFGIENSRKAYLGILAGLQDPAIIDKKRAAEKTLRDTVGNDPKLRQAYGEAWDQVAATLKTLVKIRDEYNLIGYGPTKRAQAFNSDLFDIAMTLVRLSQESPKPNAERLREYSESSLDSLKLELFSEAPIYDDLETVKLADSLGLMVEVMGADNELVKKVLAGKSPRDRAAEVVRGTKLRDVSLRKKLADGGMKAIDDSKDPMIELAKLIDPPARRIRQTFEQQVDEPQRQAYGKIANARFAVYGSSVYPDATFTLRLAFGEAKGYVEAGQEIPWATKLGGTFEHADAHENKEPFELPAIWKERKGKLNPNTPFNFVSTADIIGGNSGSPVVNREGELVGIIFDGNIQSLVLDYIYADQESRAVAVHSAGILEALRKVYAADRLVGELTGKK